MLDACIIVEGTEEMDWEGAARMYIQHYLSETGFIPSIEDQRLQDQRRPFVIDGEITVCAGHIQLYVNKTTFQELSVKAVAGMLSALGAEHPGPQPEAQGPVAVGACRRAEFDPEEYKLARKGASEMPSNEQGATGRPLEEIGQGGITRNTSEYRIFGPPGTGKTTNLTRQIRRAVETYGPDTVLVTSFSRAAAAELAGRDLPISPRAGGHAALALLARARRPGDRGVERRRVEPRPPLARHHAGRRSTASWTARSAAEDETETEKGGDKVLQASEQVARQDAPTRSAGRRRCVEFEKRWTEYKRANGLLDFTDLIDTCLHDVPSRRGTPRSSSPTKRKT